MDDWSGKEDLCHLRARDSIIILSRIPDSTPKEMRLPILGFIRSLKTRERNAFQSFKGLARRPLFLLKKRKTKGRKAAKTSGWV